MDDAYKSHASKLLKHIYSLISPNIINPTPTPNFIQNFFKNLDSVSVNTILSHVFNELRDKVCGEFALDEFDQPLWALSFLVKDPVASQALVNHANWIPKGSNVNGRVMEMTSVLGPFLRVGILPDHYDHHHRMSSSSSNLSDLLGQYQYTLPDTMKTLYNGLTSVTHHMLSKLATRESVLDFLAAVINKNSARAKMQVDHEACASNAMFMNLSAVMVRLFEPILDNETNRRKIDPKYVSNNGRLDFKGLTVMSALSPAKLHAEFFNSSSKINEQKPKYRFITECFFMTARVLHLSVIKALPGYYSLAKKIEDHNYDLKALRSMQSKPLEGIARLEEELESYRQEKTCYDVTFFKNKDFFNRVMDFYRLMMVWLVELIGGFESTTTCPRDFAYMPEHFVEDAMDFLRLASWTTLHKVDKVVLEDCMKFIIVFMARPDCIKNPYLRAKMVQILYVWMPGKNYSASSSVLVDLLEGHPFAHKFLVRNLLKVYMDVECTENSHGRFHGKFDIRRMIAEFLQYLWNIPGHRQAWEKIAKEEAKGFYFHFMNILMNDSIWLLNGGFTAILELKALEAEKSNTKDLKERIRGHMVCSNEVVNLLACTSEQIAAPLLLPGMVDRVAGMLNFFLLKLIGPERKTLKLDKPEYYEYDPKHLLKQIVKICVNLARWSDKTTNTFPAALAKDGCAYNEALFNNAPAVLCRINENARVIGEFVELGRKVKVAADEALDDEVALGDIPEEYQDPIQYTIMKDPVTLPSGVNVDRSVIERHLLNFKNDPFSNGNLSVDMLKPNVELKARIHEFIRSRKLEQQSGRKA